MEVLSRKCTNANVSSGYLTPSSPEKEGRGTVTGDWSQWQGYRGQKQCSTTRLTFSERGFNTDFLCRSQEVVHFLMFRIQSISSTVKGHMKTGTSPEAGRETIKAGWALEPSNTALLLLFSRAWGFVQGWGLACKQWICAFHTMQCLQIWSLGSSSLLCAPAHACTAALPGECLLALKD